MKVRTIFLSVLGCFAAIALGASESAAASSCQCVPYARCSTGIYIYGNGCDWDNNAGRYGYWVSSTPVVGGAMNFERSAYGADPNYGHVGKVMSYYSDGSYWRVRLRHANWPGSYFTNCGCSNVSEKEFRVLKGDSRVHYIFKPYWWGPIGIASIYSPIGDDVKTATQYVLKDGQDVINVDSEAAEVPVTVNTGQVIDLKAKAEVGERMWVFFEFSHLPGHIFAKPSSKVCGGSDCLVEFSPEAQGDGAERLYYSKKYGDTTLDLGFVDLTKLGDVMVTIKKGTSLDALETIQTISVKVVNK